jgi:hypothetical protein
VVREVAAEANPAEPASVSQRAFDAAAEAVRSGGARSAARCGLPAARQIAAELKLPWRRVLALAHEPDARQAHLLSLHGREWAPQGWLTAERAAYALRLVAGRRGSGTLTMGAYEAERAALLAGDRRDWLHGRRLRIPSADAIRLAGGGWDAALTLAELPTDERPPQAIRQTIASCLDVMERFHDHAFARGNRIPMSDERGRPWSETVAEWRQRRRERGLPEPHAPRRRGGRGARAPDYSADVGAARPGEQPHRGKWRDEAACIAWVARYLASLPEGERSTQDSYRRWANAQPGAPSPSRLAQHGGWEAMRRAAVESNV